MKTYAMATAAALVLMTGGALAQTTTTESTTVTQPAVVAPPVVAPAPVVPPPPGTLSSTETQKSVDANGDEYDSTKTTYGNAAGAATQSTSTMTMQPAPQSVLPEVVTTKKTTSTTSTSY